MPTSALRIGIVGCGGITAFSHLPALCRFSPNDVEIRYLCDATLSRAEILKERFNLREATCEVDYRVLLEDDVVDAIIVASWPSSHARIAIDCIRADKHVLIQKPLCVLQEEADQILQACQLTNKNILALPVVEGINSFDTLKAMIQAELLGKIQFVRIRTAVFGPDDYYNDVLYFFHETEQSIYPYLTQEYANQAGSIADMGPYALTAFHYLFGPGELLHASLTPNPFDSSAIVVLRHNVMDSTQSSQNFIGNIEIGWHQARGIELCTIFGSNGTAVIDTQSNLILISKDGHDSYVNGRSKSLPALPISPISAQDKWIQAIINGEKGRFRTSVETAVWVSRIITEAIDMTTSS